MFLFLQELSTLVGFIIVALAYWFWLRRQQVNSQSLRVRRLALSVVDRHPDALVSYRASRRDLLCDSAALPDFPFVRSILFRTATCSSAIAIPLSLVASGIIYVRRHRQILPRVDTTS